MALAIQWYFTPERVKVMVENKVATDLHRQVKLGGISVGLFSGLTVTDFALSEYPDFSKGTFISSERFSVVPHLLPLLQRKVFIDELALVKPTVTIIRNTDGKTFNFSSLVSTASAAPSKGADSDKASPLVFLVSKVSIESGRLSFIDLSSATQSTEINKLNLDVRNVSLVAPVDAQMDFSVKFKGVESAVKFKGSVWALKGSAKIKELHLKSGASSLKVDGEVSELTQENPVMDLKILVENLEPTLLASLGALPATVSLKDPIKGHLSAKGSKESFLAKFDLGVGALQIIGEGSVKKPADPKRSFVMAIQTNEFPIGSLLALAPVGSLPKEMKLSGNTKLGLNVDGNLDQGKMSFQLDASKMDVAYSTDFRKQAGTPLSVSIAGDYSLPLALNMRTIALVLSQLKLDGEGTYKSSGNQSNYALNLKSNLFPLEDLAPMVTALKDYGLAGKASTVMKVTSRPTGPDVRGTGQLSGASLLMHGVKVVGIASDFDYSMKDTAGKMTATEVRHDYFSGSAFNLQWKLTDVTDMAKMAGTASLKMGKGQFQNIKKLTADSKAAKILFMPITLLQRLGKAATAVVLPNFDKVTYRQISGDYTFKSGTMNVTRFDLDGAEVSAAMKGTVGLVGRQPLNLDAEIRVAAGLLGGTVGEIFNDKAGRATFKMKISGTVDDPQMSLDKADTSKKVLDVVKDQLGLEPAKEIENLLKGLFKK